MPPLHGWENFYVIIGSSAGALIGLQFVAMTLAADSPIVRDVEGGSSAFATPTIVHFSGVLAVSAILCAPWDGIRTPSIIWGLVGTAGAVYILRVAFRMRSQTAYRPVFEDWLFHALLPLAAYIALAVSAFLARSSFRESLFGVGAAVLMLLFIGIHNTWDSVTYHVFLKAKGNQRR